MLAFVQLQSKVDERQVLDTSCIFPCYLSFVYMLHVMPLEAKETHTYLGEVLASGVEHLKNER